MRAFSILILILCTGPSLWAEPPSFQELYDVLRTNVAGMDQAAAEGLLEQLKNKVSLVSANDENASKTPALSRSRLYEENFGYVRVGAVSAVLPEAFSKAVSELEASNHLKGLVIDLRFADGNDYKAVVELAHQLLSKSEPILDYGEGMKKSEANADALHIPIAVLINSKTAKAAEALAAALREAGRVLILGTKSAGQAYVFKEKTLSGGQVLRVAVAPIKIGEGKELSDAGVAPDLAVDLSAEQELMYFKDPFALTEVERQGQGNKNTRRMSEADLVRMLRDGQEPETPAESPREETAQRKVVRDPVLARALDVLKGLAVVQQSKSF